MVLSANLPEMVPQGDSNSQNLVSKTNTYAIPSPGLKLVPYHLANGLQTNWRKMQDSNLRADRTTTV